MPKRKNHRMRLEEGSGFKEVSPTLFYGYGYLWVGCDTDTDMRCFGCLDEHKTVRMAKAILRLHDRRSKKQ